MAGRKIRAESLFSICLPKRSESCFLKRMAASTTITIATVVLAALLASGCKKPSTGGSVSETEAPAVAETNTAPAATNALVYSRGKDLGVVLLTNRCETRIQVGDGKSCAIKPQLLDAQRLRLTMTLESKMADGKTRGLKIITVVAKPDQPFEVDFGSLVFILTPQLTPQVATPVATNSSPAP
jgi:hypothetical protein